MTSNAERAAGALAATTRHHRDNPQAIAAARQRLADARVQDAVERVVAQADPHSPTQRSIIASAFSSWVNADH